jgi:predicted transcriptional regulator of viral defense system
MLQRPELSGGMSHVIETFEEHAEANLPLILNELESHGSMIDRVRAGYLLEERCNIRHPRIDTWVRDAQRGGSRKLDPQSPYEATFSERWMISINA